MKRAIPIIVKAILLLGFSVSAHASLNSEGINQESLVLENLCRELGISGCEGMGPLVLIESLEGLQLTVMPPFHDDINECLKLNLPIERCLPSLTETGVETRGEVLATLHDDALSRYCEELGISTQQCRKLVN